jgi:anaphase-promoting complex subunit 6
MTHRYSRAERLLTRPFSTKPPAVPFDVKGKAREPAMPSRLPVGPTAMFDVTAEQQEGVSRLVDMSVVCRYLAAQCLVRQGKWAEATEMLGEANPFRNSGALIIYHNILPFADRTART